MDRKQTQEMILKVIFISALVGIAGCIEDVSKLNLTGNFDTQVETIFEHFRLNEQEVKAFDTVYDDVHETLRPVWPDLEVLPFGSVVNGLGLKSSDVDCLVMVPNTTLNQAAEMAMRADQILANSSSLFSDFEVIAGAKVPVIKFRHIPSGLHGDVSFSGLAAVRNSQLVNFLLHLDERALHLAVLVKYWSKVHSLTGTNLMASYSLLLQVIFYLQQKQILPAVVKLQKNIPNRMDGIWNTAFDDKYKYQTDNNETLYQLLGGFFQYYSEFDFNKFVVSTYLGRLIERSAFLDPESLTEEYDLYKRNVRTRAALPIILESNIVVQDLFEHNRGCASFVPPRLANKVISQFKFAAKMFLENKEESFLRSILTRDQDEEVIYIRYHR